MNRRSAIGKSALVLFGVSIGFGVFGKGKPSSDLSLSQEEQDRFDQHRSQLSSMMSEGPGNLSDSHLDEFLSPSQIHYCQTKGQSYRFEFTNSLGNRIEFVKNGNTDPVTRVF